MDVVVVISMSILLDIGYSLEYEKGAMKRCFSMASIRNGVCINGVLGWKKNCSDVSKTARCIPLSVGSPPERTPVVG